MNTIKPEDLLTHGVHLGHKKQKVNPAAKPFIYQFESGVSIIDLFQTATQLDLALQYINSLGQDGKIVLFVATKKGARDIMQDNCKKNSLHYITNKWTGGFLTNFSEIHKNVTLLNTLSLEKETGEWKKYVKHERTELEKKMGRISSIYEGVTTLEKVPDALFIIDIKKEKNAVSEARSLKIPTIALVDTNASPLDVDYPIVGNDDAVLSVTYIITKVIEAYMEGLQLFKNKQEVKKVKK